MFFTCDECELKFTFQYELILHRSFHKNLNENASCVLCDLCNFRCVNSDHLQNHLNQHVAVGKFKCGICSKEFVHQRTFLTHIENHNREYVCFLCDKKYKSKRNLTEHLQLHTREMPLKCHICQKLFARKDKLTMHVKTHSNNKLIANPKKRNRGKENCDPTKSLFECNQCSKQYSRKQHLDSHVLSHTGESSQICEYCGKQFLRSDHLIRHTQLHKCNYLTQQCLCTVCGKWFFKDDLKKHMIERHYGKTPYNCASCKKSFEKKGHLIFHQRTHELKTAQPNYNVV